MSVETMPVAILAGGLEVDDAHPMSPYSAAQLFRGLRHRAGAMPPGRVRVGAEAQKDRAGDRQHALRSGGLWSIAILL